MGSKAKKVVSLFDDDDHDVCTFYADPVLCNRGSNSTNPISVESFSEDEDLRIAITASLLPEAKGGGSSTNRINKWVIDLSQDDDDDVDVDAQIVPFSPRKNKRQLFRGESSNPKPKTNDDGLRSSTAEITFICDICVYEKPKTELFYIKGCTHFYCSECMAKYVASKLQENITNIPCPVLGCHGRLELEYCLSILPSQVLDRWGDALCEALILDSEKFYCPHKDCSVLLIHDAKGLDEVITDSKCPNCTRLFCATCKVPWHSQISCEDFRRLNKNETEKEDIMLMNLATKKKWQRCPKCKFYVEKSLGCSVITCRCGFIFCYNCGEEFENARFPLHENCGRSTQLAENMIGNYSSEFWVDSLLRRQDQEWTSSRIVPCRLSPPYSHFPTPF